MPSIFKKKGALFPLSSVTDAKNHLSNCKFPPDNPCSSVTTLTAFFMQKLLARFTSLVAFGVGRSVPVTYTDSPPIDLGSDSHKLAADINSHAERSGGRML